MEHAREQALAIRTGLSGTLRMTASVAFGKACIVPLLADFRAQYPGLKLELLFADARLDLITNRLDLAVRLGPVVEAEIIRAKLFDAHFRVCASPAYVEEFGPLVDPKCLSKRRCLRFGLPDFKSHWRFRQGTGPALSVPVDGDIMIYSTIALHDAAVLGLGPAMLADWMIWRDLADGRLVDLLPAYHVSPTSPDTTVSMLYPSRTFLPQKVRVMIEFLKSRLGTQMRRHTLAGISAPLEKNQPNAP
ncbi:MAG: substrate binding domain-containing protein [Alphaproteobacteria bacterium]